MATETKKNLLHRLLDILGSDYFMAFLFALGPFAFFLFMLSGQSL